MDETRFDDLEPEEVLKRAREERALAMSAKHELVRDAFYRMDLYPGCTHEAEFMFDLSSQRAIRDIIRKRVNDVAAQDLWPLLEMLDVITYNSPSRRRRLAAAKKQRLTLEVKRRKAVKR